MQQNGLSITEFAQKIQDNMQRKVDLVVPAKQMHVDVNEITIDDVGQFTPTEHFHRQVASYTDIPWKYYQRTMQDSDLLSINANHWLHQKNSKRMVRTMKGLPATMDIPIGENVARAFMSDRYRRIDNEHIAAGVLPPLMENPHTQVLTSQVTDKKMYLVISFANREAEVRKGDVVRAGIIIMNSEIGMSRFTVSPYVWRAWCDNGAVANVAGKEYGLKQIHAGRRVDADDNLIAYTDETLEADDKALQLKMRDVVASISTGPMWDDIVSGLQQAAVSEEIKKPIQAVDELSKVLKLNDTEQNAVLTNLIKSGDLTRWGAGNAVTAVANDIDDYDRATELQQIGGNLLGMPEREWNRIAEAA
jgi:hypothetical protein